MGRRGTRGTGGTVAFEKAPQNFYEGDGWVEFVQVRLLTNLVSSLASGDRSGAADAVIRRLFDVGAVIRVETRGERGDTRNVRFNFLLGGRPWEKISHHKITRFPSHNEVFCHYKINYIPQSLPVEGGSHREPLANDLLMYWTAPNWCAHGLAQTPPISPFYKSFARLFQKPRSPRSPRPPIINDYACHYNRITIAISSGLVYTV